MTEKLLLIDDEPDIRTFLGLTLEGMGYTVQTAENGEEGLEIFREFNPSVIMTDIKMPVMDGIELLRAVKSEAPDVEVVMISGHGDMDLAIQSLKFQAADFITKPINQQLLEATLGRVLERITMRRELKAHTENLEALVEEKSARLVELERRVTASQIVDGLYAAQNAIAGDVESGAGCFNEMPCFVSIHDRDLNIIAANQAYEEKFGDIAGRKSWSAYKQAPDADGQCPAAKTMATGHGRKFKETLILPGGGEIPADVHTAPILGKAGNVELVLEIAVDMSEVARLQQALDQSQKRYQRLFDKAPCYITILDQDLNIVEANQRFKTDFDAGADAHCFRAFRHRSVPCDGCPVLKTFEDGASHQYETVVTTKTGQQRYVLKWSEPVRDADGRILQVMEMATDITQIRKLQDHLASIGLMIGSASHGVKGVVMSLGGGIYLVDAAIKKNDIDRIRASWEKVKLHLDRVKKMTLDILYYAKSRDLEVEKTSAAAFVDEVASIIAPRAELQHVGFSVERDDGLGDFHIDPSALRAAMVNFLENAVDACVMDAEKPDHQVVFRAKKADGAVRFEVEDNGVGMDRETRDRMFTLFFSSKGSKGTGLGLFISNQAVEKHGGSVAIDSVEGEGSTFTIIIPKTPPGPDETAGPKQSDAPA